MKTATMYLWLATLLFVVSSRQRSFVEAGPLSSQQSGAQETLPDYQDESVKDEDVKELQNLKHVLGKTLEMMKTHSAVYTNVNGKEEAHSITKEQLNENGNLVASMNQNMDSKAGPNETPTGKIHTKVDIPSKGIHKDVVQNLDPEQTETENGNRRSSSRVFPQESNNLEKYGSYSGIQYSPLDMAEYVFWTGDEKGVTLAVEEFLREGMMSREEAISFLQEIKYNLDYLQSHYTQLGLNARERSKEKEKVQNGLLFNNKLTPPPKLNLASDFDITSLRQGTNKKSTPPVTTNYDKVQEDHKISLTSADQYDQLLEKLRIADFLYTEYSLEEVIYQLAKVMFTQSLTRGSSEAQQALQKFTNFLETEADQGRISRALEKKVLDVLIAALTDTLNEHPELEQGTIIHKSNENLLRQILQLTPEEKATVRAVLSSHKDQIGNEAVQDDKNLNHLTLNDLEKYKNL